MVPTVTREAADSALRAGRLPEATDLYETLCARHPDDAEAWATLGDLQAAQGRFDQSVLALQKAVALKPAEAGWWGNLGASLLDAGKPEAALRSFQESLRRRPDQPGVHYNLGAAYTRLGRLDEALAAYQTAISLRPDFAEAWLNLGSLHSRRRDYAQALHAAEQALRLRPGYPEAHNNLGQALASLDRHSEAIDHYAEALRLKPDYPEAHGNLAASLIHAGQLSSAAGHAREALRLQPAFWPAASNLGNALTRLGEIPETIEILARVPDGSPVYPIAQDNRLLALNYDPARTPAEIADEHRRWGRRLAIQSASVAPRRHPRLRVGYLSPDFTSHSVSFFIEPVLRHHDREQVEVYAYADHAGADRVTQRLRGLVEHWRDVHPLDDRTLAEAILRDEIDILVDLAGHLRHNRLPVFARRAAPVQMAWLGYPNTTGLAAIDYCLTDDVLDPAGADGLYSESLLRLPRGFACYQPPDDAPPVSPPPLLKNGHVTFGSFHTLAKINSEVLDLWCELLQRVPASRLRLQTFGLGEATVRQQWLDRFASRGIAKDRLLLHGHSSMQDYLQAHAEIDIGLDTLPWSGHTTTCHALWMGVPTVTRSGNRRAGRLGASALQAAGQPELVADDRDDWLRRAQALAADPPRLVHLRSTVREQMLRSPLCRSGEFVRELEVTYRKVCAAKP